MKRSTRVVGGFNGKFFENERNFLSIDRNNLLGCKYCHGALGMENRAISDSRISASSQWDANHAANQARLFYQAAGSKRGAWSARTNDANQWLQVQLHTIYKITFVATQGRNGVDQWVSKYMLHYSKDGEHFQYYRERGHNKNKVRMNRDKKKNTSVWTLKNLSSDIFSCLPIYQCWQSSFISKWYFWNSFFEKYRALRVLAGPKSQKVSFRIDIFHVSHTDMGSRIWLLATRSLYYWNISNASLKLKLQ